MDNIIDYLTVYEGDADGFALLPDYLFNDKSSEIKISHPNEPREN